MVGFLVEYTIHNDEDDLIRGIVENTLEENGFDVCKGTTLYYKEDISIKILHSNDLDNICVNEKNKLLKSIRKQFSNENISTINIINIMKLIEIQVFAIVGGSGY